MATQKVSDTTDVEFTKTSSETTPGLTAEPTMLPSALPLSIPARAELCEKGLPESSSANNASRESADEKLRSKSSELKLPSEDMSDELFVANLKDDPSLRTVTVRSCIIGFLVGILGASIAQLFVYKPVSLHVPALFIQLVSYVIGKGCAAIPGPQWWNPGPFSSKETAFAAIMATSASINAIAAFMLTAQDLYFGRRYSAVMALSTLMSSQLVGYGFAGLLRPLLIYPANCPYPSMIPSVTLIKSLAGRDRVSKAQLRFFKKAIFAISIYEVFPTYVAPALQAVSPWCLTLPQSQIVTQIFGGSRVTEGLGLFAFSFDWGTLGSYGPLYTPFVTQVNQWIAVLFSIFLYMAAYRYDWFGGGVDRGFPFMSFNLLNETGGVYNITAAVFGNGTENKAAVEQMGIPRRATSSVLATAFICLSASAAFSSALIYKWKDLKAVLIRSKNSPSKEDPHRTIVKHYREFPTYGIIIVLVLSSVTALIVSHYSKSGLSVIGMLVALLLSGIISISAGFIFASTGVVLEIFPPIQLLGGLLFRGNALANFWFTTFATTSTYQCLNILKELKLGQYLLLSPMSVIAGQLAGSIFGTFTCYLVMIVILQHERDVLLLPNGNGVITGIHILGYESGAISWGIFAQKLYVPGKIYDIVVYGMIAGLFAPIPFYLLHKWKPSFGFDKFNVAVFTSSVPSLTGTLASGQMTAVALGFWSQFYMRRYRRGWFRKYNDILNAALLGGSEITILLMMFLFQGGSGWNLKMPHYFLNPEGPPDYCQPIKS